MKNSRKSIDGIKGNEINTENVKGGQMDINQDQMGSLTVDNPEDLVAKKKGFVREKGVK